MEKFAFKVESAHEASQTIMEMVPFTETKHTQNGDFF